MRVSYKWLEEYLDLSGITGEALADKMSRTGIEVDGVIRPGEGMSRLVVGETLSVVDHPDSDHLHVCMVNIGEAEPIQIVCGAPNIAAGQKVIVALHGARIAGNQKIKKGKIRGEVSNGMICSLDELGYPENVVPKKYADGIFVLPPETPVGEDVLQVLNLDDELLDIDITPNRADALSMHGAAYEVAAIYDKELHFPEVTASPREGQIEDYVKVAVEDTADVPAYHIQVIKDVQIKESPLWLQTKLMNGGIRPLNNVVDITNYILLEYGQPLHAFDYDKLNSKEIRVRRAQENEKIVTLDGTERELDQTDIVITNGQEPIALAGVMGGLDSEVTETTTTVALEAALFHPLSIRKTASKFNLRSESSSRFEKGINWATILEAGQHAAELIHELAGGTIVEGVASVDTVEVKDQAVSLTLAKINGALGTAITLEETLAILDQLGFGHEVHGEQLTVLVPPRRWDITIEADIIEEVARIYGYDKLPATLPVTPSVPGQLTVKQKLIRATRVVMEAAGLTQNISYVLTTPEKAEAYAWEKDQAIRLAWPMSEDRSTLRMNLLSSLLANASYNVAHSVSNVAFYEVGRVFLQQEGRSLPVEEERLGGILVGNLHEKSWQQAAEAVTFYHLKGIVEAYFAQLGLVGRIDYRADSSLSWMHPGRTASVHLDGERIGYLGQLHPVEAQHYDLAHAYVFELSLDALLVGDKQTLSQTPVPKYPGTSRDIAMVVDQATPHQAILDIIRDNGGDYLIDVRLFDIYQGQGIKEGKKSMAYSLDFLNPEATLTDEDISPVMERITQSLQDKLDARIR